jgi:hypothetical protein
MGLQGVYSAAERIEAAGKKLVVAWIKGHKKGGTGIKGNKKADRAARSAIKMLRDHLTLVQPPADQLSRVDEGSGRGWSGGSNLAAEQTFLSLQKRSLLDLSNSAIRQRFREFFGSWWGRYWTVYRPVMSLTEAQDEDVAELRRYMADKYLEGMSLPRKEHTNQVEMKKAPPLRHLYHQANALKKRLKTKDHSKMYRKSLDA